MHFEAQPRPRSGMRQPPSETRQSPLFDQPAHLLPSHISFPRPLPGPAFASTLLTVGSLFFGSSTCVAHLLAPLACQCATCPSTCLHAAASTHAPKITQSNTQAHAFSHPTGSDAQIDDEEESDSSGGGGDEPSSSDSGLPRRRPTRTAAATRARTSTRATRASVKTSGM